MYLFEVLEKLKKSKSFVESKNFYFQNHICEKTGQTVKTELNYQLNCDKTDEVYRIGFCDECNTCFYHKDFESHTF